MIGYNRGTWFRILPPGARVAALAPGGHSGLLEPAVQPRPALLVQGRERVPGRQHDVPGRRQDVPGRDLTVKYRHF